MNGLIERHTTGMDDHFGFAFEVLRHFTRLINGFLDQCHGIDPLLFIFCTQIHQRTLPKLRGMYDQRHIVIIASIFFIQISVREMEFQ